MTTTDPSLDRRVKRLVVSNILVPRLFTAGEHRYVVVGGALPDDATVVGVRHEWDSTTLYVRSAAFPVVEYGKQPPEVVPTLQMN